MRRDVLAYLHPYCSMEDVVMRNRAFLLFSPWPGQPATATEVTDIGGGTSEGLIGLAAWPRSRGSLGK
jgi:hypothetical protein